MLIQQQRAHCVYRNKNTPFRLSALTANRQTAIRQHSTALIQHEQSVSDSVHVHVRGIRSDRMRPTFVSLRSPTVHAAIASLFGTSAVWAHGQRQHPAEQFMCIGGHDGVSRARGDSGSGKVVKLLQDGERGSAELSFYETNSDPVLLSQASKRAWLELTCAAFIRLRAFSRRGSYPNFTGAPAMMARMPSCSRTSLPIW